MKSQWIDIKKRKPKKEDAYFAPARDGVGENITGLVVVLHSNGYSQTMHYNELVGSVTHWVKFNPPAAPELIGFEEWYQEYTATHGASKALRGELFAAWSAAKLDNSGT